jgi:cytochrome P450
MQSSLKTITPLLCPSSFEVIMFWSILDLALLQVSVSYALFNFDITNGLIRTQNSRTSILSLFLTYISIRLICKAIYSIILHPIFFDPLRHLPQAPQANLLERFFSEPQPPDQEAWANTIPNSGLIRYYGRFNVPRVLITSPQGCEEVLQTKAVHFPKQPATRKILKMWLGTDTLLSSTNGEGHKSLRRKLLPAFYARNIRELHPVFWRKAVQMCDALHRIVAYNNDRVLEVNLDDLIDRAALDVVGLAGHGVDFNTLDEPGGRLGKLHKDAFDLGKKELQVVLTALLLPDWLFDRLPFQVYRDNRAGVKALRAHSRDLIREDVANKNTGEKNIVEMASQLEHFSEDDLVDLSMDLLVAGHKTASSAMQLAFYTLARHPEIQTRLREEIRANMSGNPISDVTWTKRSTTSTQCSMNS